MMQTCLLTEPASKVVDPLPRQDRRPIGRRELLQRGVGGVLGLGMGDLLRLRAEAGQASGKASPDQVNCILVWLDGGPTHYETFDPKPDAPSEVRGKFKPIPTTVPGVSF